MLSVVTRTLLVAAALSQTNAEHPHEHDKEPCGCAQHELDHPFTINCNDAAAIRAATVTLESTCKENNAEYEWGGSFATPANAYKWVAEAVDGAYADASMKLVVFADDHFMDNVEAAKTMMAGSCVTVNTGGEIPKPTAAGACYKLSFPTDPATDFHATVNTMGVTKVAFFAEHVPTEFERDTHYFMSADLAMDIEPEKETDPKEYNCRFHTDNQVKVCAQAFLIIQAHHDYCPRDTLTRNEEELFHQWESKCYGCAIVRKYDESLKKCPVIDCTDTTVATLGYNHLNKTCTPADTEYEFEWAASFDTPADSYTWVSQAATKENDDDVYPAGHTYADAEMKVVAFKMSSALKSELLGLKDAADTLMASTAPGSCPEATTITPTTDGACITMKFPAPATDFTAAINTADMDNVGLFTAHMPTEFERDTHYLMDAGMTAQDMADATAGTTVASGGPVEPVNQLGESGGHDHGRRLSVGGRRGRRLSAVGRNDRRSHRRLANKGECCTTATQQGAWKQVVSYHDECDHDQVPEFIEVGFHDYEASCEDHFCNLVEEGVDQTVCPSPSPPSSPSTCAADLAQCEVDKTLDAAGVLRKLKDQTFTIVSSRSGPVQVSSGPVPACTVQFPPVPLAYSQNGLKAWYCPGEYDLISQLWPDCSGNGNWALLSGSGFEKVVGKGNGATYDNVSALHGNTNSRIRFGTHNNVIQSEFTVCSVTRYTGGGPVGRILHASIDWFHGHYGGMAGVAYYEKEVTAIFTPGFRVRPNTNWLVMCGTNAGAGSQLKLANGKSVGTAENGVGDASLWVNGGQFAGNPGNQASQFAIAEVVVWSRGLTNAEMRTASNYLMESRGIQVPTST